MQKEFVHFNASVQCKYKINFIFSWINSQLITVTIQGYLKLFMYI